MDRGSDDSSATSSDLDEEDAFNRDLRRVRNNDPGVEGLYGMGDYDIIRNMSNEEWEHLGRDISNNTHLEELQIAHGALNDEKLVSLFRGLSRSSSIFCLDLNNNEFSAAGLRSLELFIQNSINLRLLLVSDTDIQTEGFNILQRAMRGGPIERLDCYNCGITSDGFETVSNNLEMLGLNGNEIKSEGFNSLLQSLRDSSIDWLNCNRCGIESIEIDTGSFPKNLTALNLSENRINSNGCRGLADLLQEGNMTLDTLILRNNLIDDDGVAILIDALKSNTTLNFLDLGLNSGITRNGRILILKLLNDMTSIKSTLQSNHTLTTIHLGEVVDDISLCIDMARKCNRQYSVAAGREKVLQTQLHSKRRAELAQIQGVEHSFYSEISPLHLPEVLSLVGRKHGQGELFIALKASIAGVLSTVSRKLCLQQRRAALAAEMVEIDAELAEIESTERNSDRNEHSRRKRLRV